MIGGEKEAGSVADLENLPDDLKEIVTFDNKAFIEEIEKWDRDMARKATGGGDADVTIVVEQKAGTSVNHFFTNGIFHLVIPSPPPPFKIEKWDRDMARKATGGGEADVTIVVEQKAGTAVNPFFTNGIFHLVISPTNTLPS